MKRKILIVVMTLFIILQLSGSITAHEIFYSGSSPNWVGINLKWKWWNSSNTKIELKCSDDYMGSVWSPYYSTAMGRWNTELPSLVYLHDNSYYSSTVDFCMPTVTWWENELGYFMAHYGGVVGLTWIQDEAGTWIETTEQAVNSTSKKIKYAQIYLTPISSLYNSLDGIEKSIVIVHELGHVMCLGHSNGDYYPTSSDSVMEKYLNTIDSDSPTTHDVNDMNSKY